MSRTHATRGDELSATAQLATTTSCACEDADLHSASSVTSCAAELTPSSDDSAGSAHTARIASRARSRTTDCVPGDDDSSLTKRRSLTSADRSTTCSPGCAALIFRAGTEACHDAATALSLRSARHHLHAQGLFRGFASERSSDGASLTTSLARSSAVRIVSSSVPVSMRS